MIESINVKARSGRKAKVAKVKADKGSLQEAMQKTLHAVLKGEDGDILTLVYSDKSRTSFRTLEGDLSTSQITHIIPRHHGYLASCTNLDAAIGQPLVSTRSVRGRLDCNTQFFLQFDETMVHLCFEPSNRFRSRLDN